MRGIIYLYRDETGKPVYVGQTVQSLFSRHRGHLSSRTNNLFDNHLQKHRYAPPEIIEYCEQSELDEREKYYIAKFNTLVPNGYNIQRGGGMSARDFAKLSEIAQHSSESRWVKVIVYDSLAQTLIVYPSISKAAQELGVSPTSISYCIKGKYYTFDHGRYMATSIDKDIQIQQNIGNHYKVPILKGIKSYDIFKNEWAYYPSLRDALLANNLKNKDGIYNCLKKRQLCNGTKLWFYMDETPDISALIKQIKENNKFKNLMKLPHTTQSVLQLDQERHIVGEYISVNQAAKVTQIPRRSIGYAIAHNTPSHGYFWILKS